MNNRKNIFLMIGVISILFFGCENKDYLIDGGVHDTKVDMTTYDYLTTNPIFDTLVLLIDKAGLKETINGDVTFIAPTDYCIQNYLDAVYQDSLGNNVFAKVHDIDDIPVQTLQDSLRQYIIQGKVNRDDLLVEEEATINGEIYSTLMGNEVSLSLEQSINLFPYTSPGNSAYWQNYPAVVSTIPNYLYYIHIVGAGLDDPNETVSEEEVDDKVLCQTSGIETTNGVLHVLANQHVLFFYQQSFFQKK